MPAYQNAKQNLVSHKQIKEQKPEAVAKRKVDVSQIVENPDTLRSEDVLAAQLQFGNQAVQRSLGDKAQPGRLTDEQGNLRSDISDSIQQSRGGGSPLPGELQLEMKRKMGRDFRDVRLHTDGKADKLSRKINARAFTIGTDIFFKNGVFAPGTQRGRETLVHELTHVVQQSGSRSSGSKLKLGAPDSAMEKEADHRGKQASQPSAGFAAGSVQRVEEEEMLQGQQEEEEIQTQGAEEEELQTQADTGVVQAQDEEEEIQTQGEEEELQMQPEAGGVVQRGIFDWFKKKFSSEKTGEKPTPPPLPAEPGTKKVEPRGKPLTEKGQQVLKKIKSTGPGKGTLAEQLEEQRNKRGMNTENAGKNFEERFKGVEAEQSHRFKRDTSKGVDTNKMKEASERTRLTNILKNPNSKAKERQEAEEQLRGFHKAGIFSKNPATIALEERKKSLKEAAGRGDKKAMALYKKENPSFGSKVMGFAGKAQEFYGKNKDTIGSVLGALGIGGGKKEKAEEKAPGGGGGEGGYASIITQLMKENQELKKKLGVQ